MVEEESNKMPSCTMRGVSFGWTNLAFGDRQTDRRTGNSVRVLRWRSARMGGWWMALSLTSAWPSRSSFFLFFSRLAWHRTALSSFYWEWFWFWFRFRVWGPVYCGLGCDILWPLFITTYKRPCLLPTYLSTYLPTYSTYCTWTYSTRKCNAGAIGVTKA